MRQRGMDGEDTHARPGEGPMPTATPVPYLLDHFMKNGKTSSASLLMQISLQGLSEIRAKLYELAVRLVRAGCCI